MITFLDTALDGYATNRDRPDMAGTSRLSPHLHWGEIGPRQIWSAIETSVSRDNGVEKHASKFLAEIGWREFSYNLLYHYPHITERNLNPAFDQFPWMDSDTRFKAWSHGRTGYPIVDAGMRELWATGYMHNRVRMIVASFLVKHLLIPWQRGARWFWDTLVDADLANNSASWQWVAGSGADAAPFFRIFNPIIQGEKFDPDGSYVRKWVPELAAIDARYIHRPWTAPNFASLKYCPPIVDHAQARSTALDAFKMCSPNS
jgi:deoxyribodipyrimidine photo-lyase